MTVRTGVRYPCALEGTTIGRAGDAVHGGDDAAFWALPGAVFHDADFVDLRAL